MKNIDEIDIYSEQLTEILEQPPGGVLRSGLLLITFIILLVSIGANFISYPEKIPVQAIVVSSDKPISIVATMSEVIDSILVNDKGRVEKGEELVRFLSATNYRHVTQVIEVLTAALTTKEHDYFISIDESLLNLNLGDFNLTYREFVRKIKEYKFQYLNDVHSNRVQFIQDRLVNTIKLNVSMKKQFGILEEEVELVGIKYDRNLSLYEDSIISKSNKENVEHELLKIRRELESFSTQIINNEMNIRTLEAEKVSLVDDRDKSLFEKRVEIDAISANLLAKAISWKRNYVILSPVSGKISFNKFYSSDEYVNKEQELFVIIPESGGLNSYLAEGVVPARGAGSIVAGQKVVMEIEDYPRSEYGVIIGKVRDVSLVSDSDGYRIRIDMPEELYTTYNILIPKRPLMRISAQINTKEYSLLERLFQSIIDIFKNQ